jgi:hypothetical protein
MILDQEIYPFDSLLYNDYLNQSHVGTNSQYQRFEQICVGSSCFNESSALNNKVRIEAGERDFGESPDFPALYAVV